MKRHFGDITTYTRKCRTLWGRAWASWYRNTTVCCCMSVVSKTSCSQAVQFSPDVDVDKLQPFLRSIMATHILGLNFTLNSWTESLALMSIDYSWPLPEATSTTVCKFVLSISSLPLSVMVRGCHACVNLSSLRSEFLSRRHRVMAVVLHCSSHRLITYWVHELDLDLCNIKI